jgi:hypothetical protein
MENSWGLALHSWAKLPEESSGEVIGENAAQLQHKTSALWWCHLGIIPKDSSRYRMEPTRSRRPSVCAQPEKRTKPFGGGQISWVDLRHGILSYLARVWFLLCFDWDCALVLHSWSKKIFHLFWFYKNPQLRNWISKETLGFKRVS